MAHTVRVATVNAPGVVVTDAGNGAYLVQHEGRLEVVFVAGSADARWAFWNGHVYRMSGDDRSPEGQHQDVASTGHAVRGGIQALTSPMPATVVKVLVRPGLKVKGGDQLIVLEAMKMELPLRAPGNATVTAVHCREGELVQPEMVLVELE